MPTSKFGRFLDNLVIAFISTLLLFAWIKKLINNIFFSLLISIILSFLLIKFISYLQNKKLRKLNIKKEEIEHMKACTFHLKKQPLQAQNNFIKKLIPQLKFSQKNYILISNNLCIVNLLTLDTISPKDIFESYHKIKLLKNDNIKQGIIISTDTKNEAKVILNNFEDIKFEIISPIELYSLMKKADLYSCSKTKKVQNKLYKLYFSNIFMQKTAKMFLRCGILLYISSLFVPYFSYYIISASILSILGIICLFFGKKEPDSPKIIESLLKKNDLNI